MVSVQLSDAGTMEVIEMSMGDQHQIYFGEVLDFTTGMAEAFHEKHPVGEIWIHQRVHVGELDEE